MTRPRRTIFHALAALSLVLCVGSAALWRRSMSTSDHYIYWRGEKEPNLLKINTGLGGIELLSITFPDDNNPSEWKLEHETPARYPTDGVIIPVRTFIGFGGGHGNGVLTETSHRWSWRSAIIPIWFLVLLFAVMPVLWIRSYRKSKRPRDGMCLSCGYDLRATPDRCPECGTMPTKAAP